MKNLVGAFETFLEIKQANVDMDEAPRKNLAGILNNAVSSASTMDRKLYKILNRLPQETAISISAKVEQLVEDRQKQ